jgi:hypothetical protein
MVRQRGRPLIAGAGLVTPTKPFGTVDAVIIPADLASAKKKPLEVEKNCRAGDSDRGGPCRSKQA